MSVLLPTATETVRWEVYGLLVAQFDVCNCDPSVPHTALADTQGPSGPRDGAASASGLAHKPLIHCEVIATLRDSCQASRHNLL